uniref:MULE transposase domain-containing protein n=1 Tax=Parascaris univalens TaxID=6257 RepID=A0A914ZRA9_PARUN
IEVPSVRGRHAVYIFRTEDGEAIEWLFQKRRAAGGGFYECCSCKKLRQLPEHRGKRTPRAQIVDGKFITDPLNPNNPHFCQFKRIGGALGQRELYKLTQKVRSSHSFKESYRMEFNAALNGVHSEASTAYGLNVAEKEEMQAVMVAKGNFKSKLCTVRKAHQVACQRQAKARCVEETGGHTLSGQRFLQYATADGDIYVFCNSALIAKALQSGCRTVCDDSCYQFGCQEHGLNGLLYSLLMTDNHVAYPIVHMISRISSEKAYTLMFRTFRELIEAEGQAHFIPKLKFMFEFERPYNFACRRVFPGCVIRGCSCDVTKAWNIKWNTLMGDTKIPEEVEEWLTQLMALVCLPAILARDYFIEVLQYPPAVDDPLMKDACYLFMRYVDRTWMQNPYFLDIWDHWLDFNETRNAFCERRHNELNVYLKETKPKLLELIDALVKEENMTHQSLDNRLFTQTPPPHSSCHDGKEKAIDRVMEEATIISNKNNKSGESFRRLSKWELRKPKDLMLKIENKPEVEESTIDKNVEL